MSVLNGPFIAPLSGKAKSLVIFLHGYGANGTDLLSLGQEWARYFPDTAFAAPNAPDVCEAWASGYQWFSIRAAEITRALLDNKALLQKPTVSLNDYIDAQLQHWGVEESQLVVAGFSQGAMMAMYAMPRRKNPCAGVIAWSGMLLDAEGLKSPEIVKMPILAIHGEEDQVVPPQSLEEVQSGFEAAKFNVETIMRPELGHGIDEFGLMRAVDFIKEGLDNKEKVKGKKTQA
jgi:phospholipase/carboxylesterase